MIKLRRYGVNFQHLEYHGLNVCPQRFKSNTVYLRIIPAHMFRGQLEAKINIHFQLPNWIIFYNC